MDATDRSIDRYRQVDEENTVYKQLRELVGLRGHLQDELLRIEAMLATDDPSLEVRHWESSSPYIKYIII